jgi:phenylacetate-CoA ligase
MFSDLVDRPLNPNAYNDSPFTFLGKAAHNDLGNIAAIDLIENGERAAREAWQNRQLTNLLKHAHARSKFWRQRMPSRMITPAILKFLPVQSRVDVVAQVESEGSLAAENAASAAPSSVYASTGSTGIPVKIHVTSQNGYYNDIRNLAQYFFYGLSLEPNHVLIGPGLKLDDMQRKWITVKSSNSWAGPLAQVFRNGCSKKIYFYHDEQELIDELKKDEIGYLVSPSRYLEMLLDKGGPEVVARLGIKLWQHVSDYRSPEVVAALSSIGVPSLSNYSAAEIGPIAVECAKCVGHYHIVHSNVIVECDQGTSAEFDGTTVGRLLVTHLHSYATPIIRYDIGDFGRLEPKCRCGHDGPVLSHIFGRGKHFLRHPDGKLLPFHISTRALLEAASFKDCRVRQPQIDTIVVEIGGRNDLTADEEAKLKALITSATDPAFKVEIKPVTEIDWGTNPKRLFFASAVA